jgi:hypothetical protein
VTTPPPSEPTFAVLLLDRESRDHVPLAKALAAARQTPLQDQVVAARNAWGIVARGLSKADATELGRTLNAAGVKAALCPDARIVEPPTVEPAVKMADLPAGPALLIAVAAITVTTETKGVETRGPTGAQKVLSTALSLGTGLPIKLGGRTRKVEVTKEEKSLAFYADLCYPDRRLRIAASKFDYSCLGERKLFNAQGNLKLLVGDLLGASPDAWQNHGTRVLMEARPMQTMGYTSLKDLEKEERWLLTLRWAARAA